MLNLKQLRQKAGMTQADLAKTMNVPLRTIQNWEQGHREPGLQALRGLAQALKTTLDDLVAKPESAKTSSSAAGPGTTKRKKK